jgi:outer membrane lipoprotein SlyB
MIRVGDHEPNGASAELTDYLRDIAAGTAGAGIGLVFGPPGAVAGAVAGPTVGHAINRVRLYLTKRREERIGFVVARAAELTLTDFGSAFVARLGAVRDLLVPRPEGQKWHRR